MIISLILLIILIGFIFYSVNFLAGSAKTVLDEKSGTSEEIIRFNLNELNDLGIIK